MARSGRGTGRRRWITILTLTGVALAVGAYLANSALHASKTIDPSKLGRVERGDLARSVVATGKIQPLSKVEVKSKASGIVKQTFVHYGEHVTKNQILVELDKEDLQARVREAKASLMAAKAALQSAEATFDRTQAEAEGTDLPFLKTAATRAHELNREGLIAMALLEDADKAYQIALNKQTVALRNVAVMRAEVAKAAAQVAQGQANLDRAEEDLRYSTIVSPMDGLVLSRNVEIGDAVSSILVLGSQATLIMTLGDVSSVYVLGKVDEADIGKVYLGQKSRIVVESFKDRKYEGQVTKISPLGVEKDNVTTFEVRASIQNPDGELKSNMTANAEIILEEKKNILMLPETAVVYDHNRDTFVEIPAPRTPSGKEKIAVKLGISSGVRAEIRQGLKEGDQVILQ